MMVAGTLIAALGVLGPGNLAGDPMVDLVKITDARSNDIVIALLDSADVGRAAEIFAALAERQDARVENIIHHLLQRHKSHREYVVEHLLRVLVVRLFNPDRPDETTVRRIRENPDGIAALLRRLNSFQSPELRRVLLLLYRSVPNQHPPQILLQSGERLVQLLRDAGGEPDPATVYEVLAFLDAAGDSRMGALAEHCVALRRLTRDRRVAHRAADTARLLLAGEQ